MSLFAFGINHHTAPLEMRERVSFAPENTADALRQLVAREGIGEAVVVSTCNRTDLVCSLADGDGESALEWFRDYHGLSSSELAPYLYRHSARQAVEHLIRVASGLDSMILGEPQILGQVKEAYRLAHAAGTVGRELGKLFQHSFSIAKQIRTDTAIGNSPVSVAFAAVTLARQIFGDLDAHSALLIGAGDTVELAARHLRKVGLGRLIIANRTLEHAHELATEFDGYAIGLEEIPGHLAEADIVIASTHSQEPLLHYEDAQNAVQARKHRPVFMVDIAVPRNIDPRIDSLEDVYLYTVDDLKEVIDENLRSRQQAARQAEDIIEVQTGHLMGLLESLDSGESIRTYREAAVQARDEVLARAQRRLVRGEPAEAVLDYLAETLTNRLIHTPTTWLREGVTAESRTLNSDPSDKNGEEQE